MNNELVSREALKETIDDITWYHINPHGELVEGAHGDSDALFKAEDIFNAIDNAPTVAERPQGEWITRHKLNSFGQDVVCFECNKCGEYKVPLYHLLITEPLKVCPNCGADMRKGGAE